MFKSRFQLSLFLFLAPFVPLLMAVYGLGEPSGLSIFWFTWAAFIEFLLSVLLIRMHVGGKLSRRRLRQGEYLLRTVIGLPITIYYTIAAPYGYTALLRLLPALVLVGQGAMLSFMIQHAVFYVIGLLMFSAFQTRGWPQAPHMLVGLTTALTAALLAWRMQGNHALRLKAARRRLESSRLARRLKYARKRLRNLASGLLPPFERDSFLEERRVAPRPGIYLLVLLDFPGLHQSLLDFQRAPEHASERAGLEDFSREWNRWRSLLEKEMTDLGFMVGLPGEPAVFGRLLAESGAPGSEKQAGAEPASSDEIYRETLGRVLEAEQDRLFELIFKLNDILELSARTVRALENRGRRGWSTQVTVLTGRGVGQTAGDGNPSWTFRGPALGEMESRPAEARLWVHETTAKTLLAAYRRDKGFRKEGNWISPGLLKEELSLEGKGLAPVPDFLERIKYGVPGS